MHHFKVQLYFIGVLHVLWTPYRIYYEAALERACFTKMTDINALNNEAFLQLPLNYIIYNINILVGIPHS